MVEKRVDAAHRAVVYAHSWLRQLRIAGRPMMRMTMGEDCRRQERREAAGGVENNAVSISAPVLGEGRP